LYIQSEPLAPNCLERNYIPFLLLKRLNGIKEILHNRIKINVNIVVKPDIIEISEENKQWS